VISYTAVQCFTNALGGLIVVRRPTLSIYHPVILIEEECVMERAIVSPGFQVAIPPAIREALGIQPGQTVQVVL
jgi:hypothetical protein